MSQTILVVDDNPDSVQMLELMLSGRGYDVLAVSSGREALELLAGDPRPNLVLLDVMMPDMSGLEVLQKMRENHATAAVPVILVTARTQDEDVLSGYRYGADYYITKPFSGKQLFYGIDLVLGRGGPRE